MAAVSRSLTARTGTAILLVLLTGAFGLRLWGLGDGSVWHDEGWSIRAIRDPIGTPDDKTPLLYYGLVHFLWLGAGETAFALRYGSVLLGLLTVALGAEIARRWAGWEAAILAAIFLGTSPLLWAYSREIRAYAGVPLLALALLWQADTLLERFSWRAWAGLLLVETALLYTHNLSVPVVAWLNLVVGGAWVWERAWRRLGVWVAGQAVVLLIYMPWVLGQAPSGTPLNTPPRVRFSLIWDVWQGYFAPLPVQIGQEKALVLFSVLLGVFALACAAAALIWRRDRRTLFLLSQAVLLPVLATAEMIVANIDFHPRYYIAGVPAALLLVAVGITNLPAVHDLRWLALPTGVALACGVGAASLTGLLNKPKYQHDDFRAIAEHYARLAEDAIILIPYGWEPALEVYYAKKAGIRAEMVGIDLHSNADTVIAAINAAFKKRGGPVHVELLTWYQLPADVRGMYPCLLESAGRRVDNAFTVQGITTQGYIVERPVELTEIREPDIDYGLVHLSGAAAGGHQAICLQTGWTLNQPTNQDWRVAARLLTTAPPGWSIASSDTDIRRNDQAPTSGWKPGQIGAAFSLLRFPVGAPPGDYTVEIGVYSRTQPRGLDRLVDGVPSGTRVPITTVRPEGTTDQAPLPVEDAIPLGEQVFLVGSDAHDQALNSGQELRITLRWQVTGDCCQAEPWTGGTISLRGEDWELSQPVVAYAVYSLDWHTFRVPAGVSGPARLTVEAPGIEPITLAVYTIKESDHLFAPPSYAVPVRAQFGGLAVLEGFSVGRKIISPDETLDLTLVWRATGTPRTSYKVFTHLLGADGLVIAQHDGYPANGERLTTGWVPDEYIMDSHGLEFNPERADYRGPARLEVGFYDPDTGSRIPVSNGVDYIILPIEITVQ